jgi:protein-disulfide isomerase
MAALAGILTFVPGCARAQGITPQQADEMIKELKAIHQVLEKLAQPQQEPSAAERTVKLANLGGHVMGRADAPITLVEFTDLQCPYCNRFTTTTFEQLRKAYIETGRVRFVSRDFPLEFHPQALPAARAVRCAGDQGKFWEMRLAFLRNAARIGPPLFQDTATELKLDLKAFNACLSANQHDAEIKADMEDARRAGVEGTPSFVLGRTTASGIEGVLIVGAQPFDLFDAKIKALLDSPGTR